MLAPTGYAGVPITTHSWLKPLYKWLGGVGDVVLGFSGGSGASGVLPSILGARPGRTAPVVSVGNATGILGFYGSTGIGQPSGVGSTGSAVGGGATGTSFFDFRTNGGTGANYYTLTDVVNDLKMQGLLAK
jgi:hypothetical protein